MGGVSSLPSGLETPEVIDLRKAKAAGMQLSRQIMICCDVTQCQPLVLDLLSVLATPEIKDQLSAKAEGT